MLDLGANLLKVITEPVRRQTGPPAGDQCLSVGDHRTPTGVQGLMDPVQRVHRRQRSTSVQNSVIAGIPWPPDPNQPARGGEKSDRITVGSTARSNDSPAVARRSDGSGFVSQPRFQDMVQI
jgi:hypothetical protein